MGTKIEYAINPFASSKSFERGIDQVNKVGRTRAVVELDHCLPESMDNMILENHNKESIKRTMQLHEQIFKHQVKELHRLYSVQRMLMEDLKRELKQTRIQSSSLMLNPDINPALKFINKQNYHLTTQCNSPSLRGFDLERLAAMSNKDEEAAGTSTSKVRIDDDDDEENEEIELKLSIGFSSSKKSSKQKPRVKELGRGYSNGVDSAGASFKFDIQECSSSSSSQENKRPHWLFQSLSINRS